MCVSVYVCVKELQTAVMGAFIRLINSPTQLCYVHSVMGCFVLAVRSVVSLPTPEGWPVTRVPHQLYAGSTAGLALLG